MPFTFAHPAIVLPLLRKYSTKLSATGLIVGSIAPDFESFINVGSRKMYSHTWLGMFWFDLPIAIILCFLFHIFIRYSLIAHLPLTLEARFHKYKTFKWFGYFKKNIFIVIISLVIGIFSHLLWDAFTHLNLYYPDAVTSTVKVFGKRLYILLQYTCSILGLLYIAGAVYFIPKTDVAPSTHNKLRFWCYIILVASIVAVLIYYGIAIGKDIDAIFLLYIVIASLLLAILLVSAFYAFINYVVGKK